MEKKNELRGGYRVNAGRPPQKTKRQTLSIRVKPSTLAQLKKMAKERNKSVGFIIDRLTQETTL